MNTILEFGFHVAIRQSVLLASIGLSVSMLEKLITRRHFADDGLLSWNVSRHRQTWTMEGRTGALFGSLLSYRSYVALLGLILAATLLMPLGITRYWLFPILTLIVLGSLLLSGIRNPYGLDGSDQMNLVLFSAAFLSSFAAAESVGEKACVWFVALQSCASYVIAGVAKLVSPDWRSGKALIGILSTNGYGNQTVYEVLRRKTWLAAVLCWGVIVFECTFPVVLFAGPVTATAFLLAGVAFHGGIALIMGLNNFFWAFIAAYPAVFVCALR